MNNLKGKFKNYSFWMSLTASILLVLNAFGEELGFKIDDKAITNIVASICGVFVILGLLTSTKSKTEDDVKKMFDEKTDSNLDEKKEEQKESKKEDKKQ